jgi:hypothetical protein
MLSLTYLGWMIMLIFNYLFIALEMFFQDISLFFNHIDNKTSSEEFRLDQGISLECLRLSQIVYRFFL